MSVVLSHFNTGDCLALSVLPTPSPPLPHTPSAIILIFQHTLKSPFKNLPAYFPGSSSYQCALIEKQSKGGG